jgi:hypothetical protein
LATQTQTIQLKNRRNSAEQCLLQIAQSQNCHRERNASSKTPTMNDAHKSPMIRNKQNDRNAKNATNSEKRNLNYFKDWDARDDYKTTGMPCDNACSPSQRADCYFTKRAEIQIT